MAETFGQISAAIPFRALTTVRLKLPGREKELVPHRHTGARAERKRQLVGIHRVVHRWDGIEISANCERVVAGDFSVVGVGRRRKQKCAAAAGAFFQRIDKFVVGPSANAGLWIGRDVGTYEHAKRCFEWTAAGKIVAATRQRMAGDAIADDGEITAPFDLIEFLRVDTTCLRHNRPDQRQADRKRARHGCEIFLRITHARANQGF